LRLAGCVRRPAMAPGAMRVLDLAGSPRLPAAAAAEAERAGRPALRAR
jgi:hypothetical protein